MNNKTIRIKQSQIDFFEHVFGVDMQKEVLQSSEEQDCGVTIVQDEVDWKTLPEMQVFNYSDEVIGENEK